MNKKTIIVTGGGTGGHLMPAISICEELFKQNFRPILITDKRCENYLPKNLAFDVIIIEVARASGFFSFYKPIFSGLKGLLQVFSLMQRTQPKLLIACGGYSSLPVLLAAMVRGVKFVLHEQNAITGTVNYLLSYLSQRLFISFIHTINLPLIDSKKIVWTGIPTLESHNYNGKIVTERKSSEITIMCTGGSQGASIFDELLFETIKILVKKLPKIKFNIIQQVRSIDEKFLSQEYKAIGVTSDIAKFYHNINEKYSTADILIARAGASTINEIIHYELPSILVPYPYAKNNHQMHNAMNLVEFKAAWLIEQKKISPEILATKIQEILGNKDELSYAQSQLKKLQIDSRKIIMQEVYKIIDKSS